MAQDTKLNQLRTVADARTGQALASGDILAALFESDRGFDCQVERKTPANHEIASRGRRRIGRNEDRRIATVEGKEARPHTNLDLIVTVREDFDSFPDG